MVAAARASMWSVDKKSHWSADKSVEVVNECCWVVSLADMCIDLKRRSMIRLDPRVSHRVGSMISLDPTAKLGRIHDLAGSHEKKRLDGSMIPVDPTTNGDKSLDIFNKLLF